MPKRNPHLPLNNDTDLERLAEVSIEQERRDSDVHGPRPPRLATRRARIVSATAEQAGDTAGEAMSSVLVAQLWRYLPQLTPRSRQVIVLAFGLPERQGGRERAALAPPAIAAELGISVRAVRAARAAGLRELRELFGVETADGPPALAEACATDLGAPLPAPAVDAAEVEGAPAEAA